MTTISTIHSFSEWSAISSGTTINVSRRRTDKVHLRTAGTGHFDIHIYAGGSEIGFECELTPSTRSVNFDLHVCDEGLSSCCNINMPAQNVREWVVYASDSNFYIECEGTKVVVLSKSSLSNCISSSEWSSLPTSVRIYSDDEVTQAYKIISTCIELDPTWTGVTTSDLPVMPGTSISVTCEQDGIFRGDLTVTCVSLNTFSYTEEPSCRYPSKCLSARCG